VDKKLEDKINNLKGSFHNLKIKKGSDLDLITKARSVGPFMGPRGGKWADPELTIHWESWMAGKSIPEIKDKDKKSKEKDKKSKEKDKKSKEGVKEEIKSMIEENKDVKSKDKQSQTPSTDSKGKQSQTLSTDSKDKVEDVGIKEAEQLEQKAKDIRNQNTFNKIVSKTGSKVKNWSDEQKAFFTTGEHNANSEHRSYVGNLVRKKAKGIVKVLKHEAEEFKHAGQCLKTLFTPPKEEKPTKQQVAAVRKVGTHILLTAGTMFATGGLGVVSGGAGKFLSGFLVHYFEHVGLESALKVLAFAKAENSEEISLEEAENFITAFIEKFGEYLQETEFSLEDWEHIINSSADFSFEDEESDPNEDEESDPNEDEESDPNEDEEELRDTSESDNEEDF